MKVASSFPFTPSLEKSETKIKKTRGGFRGPLGEVMDKRPDQALVSSSFSIVIKTVLDFPSRRTFTGTV